jgi:translation initiation factor IF-2
MAGIGLKQLAASLVKKKVLEEGIGAEELLAKMKEANVFTADIDLDVRVQTAELQKFLIYLRRGSSGDTERKKLGVSSADKRELGGSGSKILFRRKSTQHRNVVEIESTNEPLRPIIDVAEKTIEKTLPDVSEETTKDEPRVENADKLKKKEKEEQLSADAKHVIQTREDLAHSLKAQLVDTSSSKKKTAQTSESEYSRMKRLQKEQKSMRVNKKKGRKTKIINVRNSNKALSSPRVYEPVVHDVLVPEMVSVADLAKLMSVKSAAVIKALMSMGSMATVNQIIDQDTACLLVEELGHRASAVKTLTVEDQLEHQLAENLAGDLVERAPVVTIMGHVDHGKTSLLDFIRRTKMAAGEAGGITQHIGAYRVNSGKGPITFLDTPGHEAFTAMRARGAKCTDIVILVVAADDGVMPQTQEAIQHAKAADVPLIVAINKMDKPGADPDNIRNQLLQYEVVPEELGGANIFQNISAKTGEGIDELLDSIVLQAEMMELKALETGTVRGVVVDSRLDKGRGPMATVLVTEGKLTKGDILLAGKEFGRVRLMLDDAGCACESAGPSTPVQVLGLSGVPRAGDDTVTVPDERKAREVALFRKGKFREVRLEKQQASRLENIFDSVAAGKAKTLNVILKADVQGSLEAIMNSVNKLASDEVKVNFIVSSVGGISQTDINLAMASRAIVIGFNVRAGSIARSLADKECVEVRYYSIIYNLIDDIRSALVGMLSPVEQEKIIGLARVQEVFRSSKLGAVAGCLVSEGVMKRDLPVRVLRENVVIFQGELESLRRFKEVATEVKQGIECGIGVKNYNDIKVGDKVECFQVVSVARTML